jgi:F-type H+-transporting ATPase subunit gamma
MSRRREIARRLEALSDIGGIMSAMKGIALMEARVLTDFLASQRRMVAGIEAAAADFLADHAEFAGAPVAGREFCVLVGSEQGFCGDFNETLLARMAALCEADEAPVRWAVVGRRLASRIGERDRVALMLPGAIVADEVPAVLLRLTRALSRSMADDTLASCGLSAFYHSDALGGIRMRRLLPLRDLPAPRHPNPYSAELNLPAGDFLSSLTGHYLHAVLNELLYDSLMAENRQRQVHMDRALDRLDEDIARLRLAYNTQRQEEITEEIEILLLAADMVADADRGHQVPARMLLDLDSGRVRHRQRREH